MALPPAPSSPSCPTEAAAAPPRRPVARRLLLVGLGLALGSLLAVQYASSPPGGSPVGVPPAQAIVQALTGTTPEERFVFATTTTPPTAQMDLLPVGVPFVYGFYEVPGVRTAGAPKAQWRRNGVAQGAVAPASLTPGTRPGAGMIALRAPNGGFEPGVYEVELTFDGGKVTGSFVTAWGAEAILSQAAPKDAEALVTNVAFAAAVGQNGKPQQPRKSFYGTDRVYFVFKYSQAEPGSTVQVKWYGGEQAIESAEREVLLTSVEGWGHAWLQAPMPGLPPGQYRAAVSMSADTPEIASGTFTIVEGGAPREGAVR